MKFIKLAGVFVLSVLVAEALAAAASTQFVLRELAGLGADASWRERLAMTAHDVVGMLPQFGSVIAAAFLVALPVAALISRRLRAARPALFALAGGMGVVTAILVMQQVFDIMPIAGARTGAGLFVQGLAGAVAGYLFERCRTAWV